MTIFFSYALKYLCAQIWFSGIGLFCYGILRRQSFHPVSLKRWGNFLVMLAMLAPFLAIFYYARYGQPVVVEPAAVHPYLEHSHLTRDALIGSAMNGALIGLVSVGLVAMLIRLYQWLRNFWILTALMSTSSFYKEQSGVKIYRFPSDHSPFAIGMGINRVFIPNWLTAAKQQAELNMALSHEMVHLAQKDQIFHMIGALAMILGAFSPFTYFFLSLLREDVEIACDHLVLMQGYPRREYGELILSVRAKSSQSYMSEAVLAMSINYVQFKRRIEKMKSGTKVFKMSRWGMLVVCSCSVTSFVVWTELFAGSIPGVVVGLSDRDGEELIKLEIVGPKPLEYWIEHVAHWTGKNVIIGEGVKAEFSLSCKEKLSPRDAYQHFKSAIEGSCLMVEENETTIKVVHQPRQCFDPAPASTQKAG